MKYNIEENQVTVDNVITMEHRGQTLTWNIRTFRSVKVNANFVTDINGYWAKLPLEQQDAIFNLYQQIADAFESIEATRRLDEALLRLVAELFKYHPFEDIMKYYHSFSRIKLPTDLKDGYGRKDTPELTYLRNEYYELLGLAIVLKIMVPIWGTYISIIAAETGTNFKEYRAARLLQRASIVNSNAYKRLYNYIYTYWEGYTEEHSGAAIVAGLDGSQVPNWLLGNVLIRRISTTGLLQANDPSPPEMIISAIYNYIDYLTKTMDKQFGGRINEKGLENSSASDDDNTSVAENYKIKQEISEGLIVTHELHLINNAHGILQRLDPTCPVDNLRQVQHLCQSFNNTDVFQPTLLSKALTMWVLDPVVTAKMIDYVNYNAVLSAHMITYTLLKHWGYHSLALLLFAQRAPNDVAQYSVKLQITDEQMDVLDKIYPHAPNTNTKRKPARRDNNVAAVGIRQVASALYATWWQIASWENEQDYPGISIKNRVIGIPHDLEPRLADLVIHLKTNIHPGLQSWVDLKTGKPNA